MDFRKKKGYAYVYAIYVVVVDVMMSIFTYTTYSTSCHEKTTNATACYHNCNAVVSRFVLLYCWWWWGGCVVFLKLARLINRCMKIINDAICVCVVEKWWLQLLCEPNNEHVITSKSLLEFFLVVFVLLFISEW